MSTPLATLMDESGFFHYILYYWMFFKVVSTLTILKAVIKVMQATVLIYIFKGSQLAHYSSRLLSHYISMVVFSLQSQIRLKLSDTNFYFPWWVRINYYYWISYCYKIESINTNYKFKEKLIARRWATQRQTGGKGLVTSIAQGLTAAHLFSITKILCFVLQCLCGDSHLGRGMAFS